MLQVIFIRFITHAYTFPPQTSIVFEVDPSKIGRRQAKNVRDQKCLKIVNKSMRYKKLRRSVYGFKLT